jgi:hypothetical protein
VRGTALRLSVRAYPRIARKFAKLREVEDASSRSFDGRRGALKEGRRGERNLPRLAEHRGRRAQWAQSWRRVQKLPPEEFEDARELAERLRTALVSELNDAYRKIRELLDGRVKSDPYRLCFALDEHYSVNTPTNIL